MDIFNIYNRMRNGDALTDEEIKFAYRKFNDLAKALRDFGDVFYTARVEANQRAAQLSSWYFSRTNRML